MIFGRSVALLIIVSEICSAQDSAWVPSRVVSFEYPVLAQQSQTTGVVRIRCTILKAGEIETCEAVAGKPLLAQPVFAAVRNWRFSKTPETAHKLGDSVILTFVFRLEEPAKLRPETIFIYNAPYECEVVSHSTLRSH